MSRLCRILICFVIGLGLSLGWGWQSAIHAQTVIQPRFSPAPAMTSAIAKAAAVHRTHQEPNFYAND